MIGGIDISAKLIEMLNAFEVKWSVKVCSPEPKEIVLSKSFVKIDEQITNASACLASDYVVRSLEN